MTAHNIRSCLGGALPSALAIQAITGSLGNTLRHSLLPNTPGLNLYVEAWDLDWATADPSGYPANRTRKCPDPSADSTSERELDPRRAG
jgi:hypothetical protein